MKQFIRHFLHAFRFPELPQYQLIHQTNHKNINRNGGQSPRLMPKTFLVLSLDLYRKIYSHQCIGQNGEKTEKADDGFRNWSHPVIHHQIELDDNCKPGDEGENKGKVFLHIEEV